MACFAEKSVCQNPAHETGVMAISHQYEWEIKSKLFRTMISECQKGPSDCAGSKQTRFTEKGSHQGKSNVLPLELLLWEWRADLSREAHKGLAMLAQCLTSFAYRLWLELLSQFCWSLGQTAGLNQESKVFVALDACSHEIIMSGLAYCSCCRLMLSVIVFAEQMLFDYVLRNTVANLGVGTLWL